LVLVAGVLATATVMGAAIWQRRRRFARMKVQGYDTRTLWHALVCESALLIGAGCLIGACLGIYGQLLLSHALVTVTGFPVIVSANVLVAFGSFALMTIVAATCIAIPGYRAADVAPYP
jgi:putative ABC transport system permease protein